jgi:hypothetical protein
MRFKMEMGTLSLAIEVDYNTYIGEVEIEDIRVYLPDDIAHQNIAPVLDTFILDRIQDQFYRELPEPVDGGEDE